ncbi:hypothetical protein AMK59_7257 [Oryctes borbonicus]|uniref:Torsin-1A C-terminal domain-containing protein n=1 Tax=Oryctes borbonicus TaxID=1629725 RepID=A0A0T6B175_9SCAR|nr:hypothetical protein AMK59_7257 [Oryctes borbonicus]
MRLRKLYVAILHFTLLHLVSAEIFSAITAGIAAAATGLYYSGRCYVGECCHQNHMPADFDRMFTKFDLVLDVCIFVVELKKNLESKMFGQHIAIKTIVNALKHHWSSDHIQKPLTISLHGSPGTGKNYITAFVKKSLYSKGVDSKFVHHWVGRIHFRLEEEVTKYQNNLYSWIKGNVTMCGRQLFIFDEVDKMPAKILDIIKPMIDYNERVEGVDYRQSIFIFISNTGSAAIVDTYLDFWKNGNRREGIKLKDFEKIITQGAFNEAGGFYRSDTIKSNLIDHYIPFLPMELEHVRMCIVQEFNIRNVTPSEHQIQNVLEYIEWGPNPENVFSKTGCKRLSQKVAVISAAGDEY